MLPTQAEIQEEAQNVEDLLLLEAEQKAEEQAMRPVARPKWRRGGVDPRAAGGARPGVAE